MICLNVDLAEYAASESSAADRASFEADSRMAHRLFHASPYRGLRSITCVRQGDVLVLRGRVDSFHMKQIAQETVRRHTSGQLIANLLTVD